MLHLFANIVDVGLYGLFKFYYYHLHGPLDVGYNISFPRFVGSWNIIINGLHLGHIRAWEYSTNPMLKVIDVRCTINAIFYDVLSLWCVHAYYYKVATHLVYLHEWQQLNLDCKTSFSHGMKMPSSSNLLHPQFLNLWDNFTLLGQMWEV